MKRFTFTANPTANYRSNGWAYTSAVSYLSNGEPWFTWDQIPLMVRDPAVRFGLHVLSSPYAKVKIKETKPDSGKPAISGPPEVRQYIARSWRKFWAFSMPRLLKHFWKWGRAPGGNEWQYDPATRRLELSRVRAIEPYDAVPHVFRDGKAAGQFAGYDLRSAGNTRFVGLPHAFYFAGDEELGPYCDQPRIAAAFAPWLQKNAPMGLMNARRLHAWTQAVGVTVVRHPGGSVLLGNGQSIPAETLALQLGMAVQNGSVLAMNSKRIPGTDKPEWDIEQREPRTGGKDVAEAVKDADGEIWFGMGIPNEIIRAMDSGSGYSGRSVPMEVYLGSSDQVARAMDQAFRRMSLEPGIKANFGRNVPWDYELSSLLEEYLEANKPGGGSAPPAGPADPSAGPPGGGGQMPPAMLSGVDPGRLASQLGRVGRKENKLSAQDSKLRAAAALAMIESRLDELDNPADANAEDAEGERDDLAELTDDPEAVAEALGSVSLSWVAYGQSRSGKTRWKDSDTGKVRYQQTKPGEGREKRTRAQADAATGHGIIDKVVGYKATPEDLRALSDHIPAMNRNQLAEARRKLQARFGNARRRDDMVKKLREHIHGRLSAIEGAGVAAGPKLRDDQTPAEPKVTDVHTVPVSSLKRRPDLMQYKVSGIKEGGVTDELKQVQEYNPELGGTLLVWRHPVTGEDIVVNGHHRHELAERTGAGSVNVRYINAPNVAEARAKGALANIAEGRGTAVDAAKYLRDTGTDVDHLKKSGVSISGKVAADALVLRDLGDKPFQALTEGKINEGTAVAVARHLKDPKLQDMLFKKLEKRQDDGEKEWSTKQIEVAAKKLAAAGTVTEKTSNLFGDFEDEKSTWEDEVELTEHAERALSKNVNDYAAVSNVGRAERVKDAGNVLSVEENQRRRKHAELEAETFSQLAHRSGPIADTIREWGGKVALAKGKERERIKNEAVGHIRDAIGRELRGDRGERSVASVARSAGEGGGGHPADNPATGDESEAGDTEDEVEPDHTHETTLPDGKAVRFKPSRPGQLSPGTYATVEVDPQKLSAGWEKDDPPTHIPPGGGGAEIPGRRAGFERFLATGKTVEAPHVNINADGSVNFANGRHRFSVLRDMGAKTIPVTVPKEQAERTAAMFGPGGPVMLSAVHAPAGGATVAGQQFAGGQFIPGEVLAKASPAERAAVGADPVAPAAAPSGKPVAKHAFKQSEHYGHAKAAAARAAARAAEAGERMAKLRDDISVPYVEVKAAIEDYANALAYADSFKRSVGTEAREDFISHMVNTPGGNNQIRSQVLSGTKWTQEEYGRMNKAHRFLAEALSQQYGEVKPVYYGRTKDGRAYYQYATVHVSRATDEAVYVHEIGHHLEEHLPGVREKVAAFLAKRVGDEQPTSLRDKFGNHFEADEMGRADNFGALFPDDPSSAYYVGKVYEGGVTEVLSMGLELLYRDPVHFAETDPEYYDFVVGILRPEGGNEPGRTAD